MIGNFGDGVLNAYTPSGAFIDSVRDAGGNVITNLSLWDLVFGGGGSSGDPNTLYLTAGGMNEAHGVFASLAPTQASGGNTPSFSVSASPNSATLTPGGSANFTINVAPTNGFNSAVAFSCSGLPAGAKCVFSTNSYNPGGTTAPMLTITTTAAAAMKMAGVPSGVDLLSGMTLLMRVLLAIGILMLIIVAVRSARKLRYRTSALIPIGGLALVLVALIAAAGCGGGGKSSGATTATPAGTSMVIVTGTSGTLSNQATITLTVN